MIYHSLVDLASVLIQYVQQVGPQMGFLSKLTKLTVLDVSDNGVNDHNMRSLANLHDLRELGMNHSYIYPAGRCARALIH